MDQGFLDSVLSKHGTVTYIKDCNGIYKFVIGNTLFGLGVTLDDAQLQAAAMLIHVEEQARKQGTT